MSRSTVTKRKSFIQDVELLHPSINKLLAVWYKLEVYRKNKKLILHETFPVYELAEVLNCS